MRGEKMNRWPLTTSSGDVMDDTGGKTLTFKKTDEKHTHTKVKAMTSFQLDVFFFPAAMYLLLLLLFWENVIYQPAVQFSPNEQRYTD